MVNNMWHQNKAGRPRPAGQLLLLAAFIACATTPAVADDAQYEVRFADDKSKQRTVEGKIIVTAQDGGIVVLARDGMLWNITPKQLKSKKKSADKFKPLTKDELTDRLETEFGTKFRVKKTRRYVICSNAGSHYSNWVAVLLERVSSKFLNLKRSKALKITAPAHPLTVIIFADRTSYAAYAARDAGPGMKDSHGYYSIRTNRVVLYDISAGPGGKPVRFRQQMYKRIAQSPFNVATIVHEAVHQIAYNAGLHTRYADNPIWLTEGMAMYYESPQAGNPTGWKSIGKINPFRINPLRKYLSQRPKNSLQSLVSTDKRFTNGKTAGDAYAEAWALTFFLKKERRKQYEKYLAIIARKPPLIFDKPAKRWKEFQTVFGDPAKLDAEFVKYMSNPRLR